MSTWRRPGDFHVFCQQNLFLLTKILSRTLRCKTEVESTKRRKSPRTKDLSLPFPFPFFFPSSLPHSLPPFCNSPQKTLRHLHGDFFVQSLKVLDQVSCHFLVFLVQFFLDYMLSDNHLSSCLISLSLLTTILFSFSFLWHSTRNLTLNWLYSL